MIIVCGTDFSEHSRAAGTVAVALASHAAPSDLWLVHVLDPATSALDSAAEEAVTASAQKRLEEEAHGLEPRDGTRIHRMVIAGPASDALVRFAEAKKARLLVVASQGYGARPLYRLGGTSERVAQSTDLPVLVVRDAAPFEAWAKEERPLRVLLAIDWSRSAEPAIRWVKTLREAGPCDVVVGHVYYPGFSGEGARRYGGSQCHSLLDRDPEAERVLARDLAARVGDLGGRGQVLFRPKHGLGRLGDHLLELAEAERADLIVVGTHHKRGLGRLSSVAAVTLRYSHCSVAIAPVPSGELFAPDEVPCIRRVVVPTDLSPHGNYAVAFGYTLLSERGGEVYLLHVLAAADGSDTEVAAQLRSLVPKRGVPLNITTRTEVAHDRDAAHAISEAAERLGADAICMASRGRTGMKRAVLGSVAESVMREGHCPVFVVRPLPP
jgi:nucleotide-binding universal stress UspA family protein